MKKRSPPAAAQTLERRATLKEVARAAGVSLSSASYAVNGTGSLGEETREHILRVAARLGYRQNLAARAMRTGKTGTLGLVVPDLTHRFFPLLAQSAIQAARHYGCGVIVTDSERSRQIEAESIRLLVRHGVDGVIWFPIDDTSAAAPLLRAVPTLVVDRTMASFESIAGWVATICRGAGHP